MGVHGDSIEYMGTVSVHGDISFESYMLAQQCLSKIYRNVIIICIGTDMPLQTV